MAYKHTNSKGVTYYLHKTEVTLRGGKPQTIYFFTKVEKNEKGKRLGAICAAPMVLGSVGVLRGKHATCYPGFEKRLTGAEYTGELCTIDGNITTGKGPAAAFIYGFAILEQLTSAAIAKDVKDGMLVSELIKLH